MIRPYCHPEGDRERQRDQIGPVPLDRWQMFALNGKPNGRPSGNCNLLQLCGAHGYPDADETE
jgi:hypothetical protein